MNKRTTLWLYLEYANKTNPKGFTDCGIAGYSEIKTLCEALKTGMPKIGHRLIINHRPGKITISRHSKRTFNINFEAYAALYLNNYLESLGGYPHKPSKFPPELTYEELEKGGKS